jgi:hypothetical protein
MQSQYKSFFTGIMSIHILHGSSYVLKEHISALVFTDNLGFQKKRVTILCNFQSMWWVYKVNDGLCSQTFHIFNVQFSGLNYRQYYNPENYTLHTNCHENLTYLFPTMTTKISWH